MQLPTPPRILMATARDSVEARVDGLENGADDYIVKPYALSELVARLRALMRRPAEAVPPKLRTDTLDLDPRRGAWPAVRGRSSSRPKSSSCSST